MRKNNFKREKGIIVALILVFGAIFLILLSSVLTFILIQVEGAKKRLAWAESLQIAEAGVSHYRWCLNNNIEDSCSLNGDYYDISGNLLGGFSLSVDAQTSCGETISRNIVSEGWSNSFPGIKRKINVLYARASVAKYAYLLNDNVWAGPDREVRGLYHSNGGIRMDGENTSTVSSVKDEWVCTASFGCGSSGYPNHGSGTGQCPSQCRWGEGRSCICPGVFSTTENSNPDLFDFPASPFDFDGITIDLAKMKSVAQTSAVYLPPAAEIDSRGLGYHLIFKNDGTVEVRIITSLNRDSAYSLEEGWHYDYFRIRGEYFYNSFAIPSSCQAIFVEDNFWLEGTVKGKISVASADLINPNRDTSVVLTGDIRYADQDGSDGLAVIAQKNILISPDSPDSMELYGIFIAQKGRFGRNLYYWNIKNDLRIFGAIVSNGRVGTQWTSGSSVISGYLKRENYVDSALIYNPPCFVPYVENSFKVLRWREER
ncbi:MAG TPA: hypothetical protein ENL27_00570 [Candidatus Parcubacteria bacterium]|nr:hypothetical protein [Candidatus Parcubacteria bacterium]